jgi:anti-sigma factor RsiW
VQAAARLATLGIEVSVPTADDEWIALVDVRSCDYDGGPMAHLLYEVDGQSFSLFVVPKARHGEGTFEVLGQQEHLWLSAGEACVLVGPQDAVAMDEVIAYVRAISER